MANHWGKVFRSLKFTPWMMFQRKEGREEGKEKEVNIYEMPIVLKALYKHYHA